jgi:type IV pilus assembly protein PilW
MSMPARSSLLPPSRRSRGVSLVEIMVGVAIGLIGTVAIFQAVGAWSRHTQTTSAGGDAQVAGTLALFNIERDVKAAGHGFGTAPLPVMGCAVTSVLAGPPFNLVPINIQQGAGGAPDTISILYGNSPFFVAQGNFTSSTATTKTLTRRSGFRRGDVAVVAGPGVLPGAAPCELIEITDDTNLDGLTVDHAVGNYPNFYSGAAAAARFNGVAAPPALAAGTIYSLGPQPTLNVWSIAGGRLSRTEQFAATPPIPVADGVVNIKAEYGVDLNNDGQIANAEWQTVAPADFRTVLAIRVAVLVRSRHFERSADSSSTIAVPVTPNVPTYFAYTGAKAFLMTNVDGTLDTNLPANPNNWRYYRYRVYERVIPLRNLLWGTYG